MAAPREGRGEQRKGGLDATERPPGQPGRADPWSLGCHDDTHGGS